MSSKQVRPSTDTGFEGPRGREEIRDAVLDAADILFANRRPSQVSIREIAAVAGVNHALVHRHFETKENLVREALERADTRMSQQWAHVAEPGEVTRLLLGNREMYHHALLMLEGAVMDGVTHGASSRLLDGLIDRLAAHGATDQDAATESVTAVWLSSWDGQHTASGSQQPHG